MKKRKNKVLLLLYILVVIFINIYVVNIAFVFGDSMSPTLNNGNIVLVKRWNVSPEVGDVVVTTRQNSLGECLIKRVVAVGGQTVIIQDGQMFVDGILMTFYEDIVSDSDVYLMLPQDTVFLVGDNYEQSIDSRTVGLLAIEEIQGIVMFLE